MPPKADEFLAAAVVAREGGHGCGTLDQAEALLLAHPEIAAASILTAVALGNEAAVGQALRADRNLATATGGPYGWDPLTYLCFSRYLRLQALREAEFVRTARLLLEAGASANTGFYEEAIHPGKATQEFESVLYGAAGVARSVKLTRLLLEYGADPNDNETPYHAPETYDNDIVQTLLDSGKLTPASLTVMLVRKADWHDIAGLKLLLTHGADPNLPSWTGDTALQHAIRRDNSAEAITLLLDFKADPTLASGPGGPTGLALAARRGRGDLLRLFAERGIQHRMPPRDNLIAACALGNKPDVCSLVANEADLQTRLPTEDGALLADFAGNGNLAGVRCLLDLGLAANTRYMQPDRYLGIARQTTALHVAAWRAWPEVVEELLRRGAEVNAQDGDGITPLALAVRACVASYWTNRRSPDSVKALLSAGATLDGTQYPCGYDEVDRLLAQHASMDSRRTPSQLEHHSGNSRLEP